MTILHITSGDDKYGSALALRELLEREVENDVVPVVVSPRKNSFTEYCENKGIKCYVIYYEWSQIPKHNIAPIFAMKYLLRQFLYHTKNPKAERLLEEIIVKEKVDLVHTNSMVVDVAGKVATKYGLPHVWHLRELLKENYNCYPIHKDYINRMSSDNSFFLAVSEFTKTVWTGLGIDSKRISVIYDGVDAERFTMNSEKDVKSVDKADVLRMVMCGSFCEAKGQKLLVKAISRLNEDERKQISIAMYGNTEGTYYSETVKMINDLKVDDSFEIKGYSNNIPEELQCYSCGVMCSENEAFGRVTVEYMLAGLCPIVPDAGANRELTNNGEFAILYDRRNADGLTEAIRKIIANKELVDAYGIKGREYAKTKFDVNSNILSLLGFFGAACSK
ncbi:MAG: glycosyltransferase family 4 protein [Lachnospiraceae bacterium]|nr:glycosyltransferase family 4 protein [Lachnospiraceae bacterium]